MKINKPMGGLIVEHGLKGRNRKDGLFNAILRFESWISIKEACYRGGAFSFLVGSLFSAPQTLIALYARGIYLALSISRCNGFHRNDTR